MTRRLSISVLRFIIKCIVLTCLPISMGDTLERGKLLSGLTYRGSMCFWRLAIGRRLTHRFIRERRRVSNIADCEDKCLMANFNCYGFNFRVSSFYMDNCELGSKDTQNINIDDNYYLTKEEDYDYYERRSFQGQCRGSSRGNGNWHDINDNWYDDDRYPNGRYDGWGRGQNDGRECFQIYRKGERLERRNSNDQHSVEARDYLDCVDSCLRYESRSGVKCRTFAFSYYRDSYGGSWYGRGRGGGNCQLSDRRADTLDTYNELVPDYKFDVYTLDEYRRYCSGDGYDDDYERGRRSVTVSGERCRYRSYCTESRAGGFFYCNTEDGGWDYCCRPEDYCEYSRGYSQSWCYVGKRGSDQWRPCKQQQRGGRIGRARAYLKDEEPDVKKRLDEPRPNEKPEGIDVENPIDLTVKEVHSVEQ